MTLRFIDSFDHYATADIGKKWFGSYNTTISVGNGRNGSNCADLGGAGTLTLNMPAISTMVCGFAFKHNSNSPGGYLFGTYEGGTGQLRVGVNADGTVTIYRWGTPILGPSVQAFSKNVYYFVEFKITYSETAPIGSLVLKVNGVTWLSNTGVLDTNNGSNTMTIFQFMNISNASDTYYDDFYFEDGVDATATQGAPNNDFLGDHRVIAINPNADGNYHAQFTRNGVAGSDYGNVDETTPNDDTDYLSSATAGHRSSHTFTSIPAIGTVKAVQYNVLARKDDAGTKVLDVFMRRSGADTDAASDFYLPDGYTYKSKLYGKHPDGTAWTPAEVNAIEAGIKVVS